METNQRFYVYKGLNAEGYLVVAEGNAVLAVYYHVFGPASREACDAFVANAGS